VPKNNGSETDDGHGHIGTTLIHLIHGNSSFSDRIPTSNEKAVKHGSGLFVSTKLLKFMNERLPRPGDGLIPDTWTAMTEGGRYR
jgi:hypothetical protein